MLRVPLIRVEGKRYSVRPDLTMTPKRFAEGAQLERGARDQVARDAEEEFGFQPSLYFFAGVAHPSFGDVVLAYHPEPSTAVEGNATTFDTGGMYLGFIKGKGLSTPTERKGYVASDRCALDIWRGRASAWVEDNFDDLDGYLQPQRRPRCNNPDDRLGHPQNEQRAWTFEVRLYRDQHIFDDLAFAIVRQEFLQQALAESLGADHQRLLDLLAREQLWQHDSPCEASISRIKDYVEAARMAPS